MNIRLQLLLVMVAALFIITTLVGSVQLYTAYYQTRENTNNLLLSQATQFSNQVESWFTLIKQNGKFLASEKVIADSSGDELQLTLSNMHNELGVYDNLIVTDSQGVIIQMYPYNAKMIGQSMWLSDCLQEALQTKTTQIGRVTLNETTGKLTAAICQPIVNSQGQVVRMLVQNIKLDLLHDMTEDEKVGKTGTTFIFTDDGQQIAPQYNTAYSGIMTVPQELVYIYRRDWRVVSHFVDDDDTPRIAATIRVKTPGWGIGVTITEREVMQTFYNSVAYGLITFCVIFLLLTAIFTMIFNRLFRSITMVTGQLASMHGKNLDSAKIDEAFIASVPPEFQLLCRTFNKMADTIRNNVEEISTVNAALQEAYDSMEIKVELRSQDLLAMNEELQAVNQELEQALGNLKQTQGQLIQSEKMALLGSLVAGIAHEINTPIGVGVTAISHLGKVTQDVFRLYEENQLKRSSLEEYFADVSEAVAIVASNLDRASQLIRSFKQVSVDQSNEERRVFNVKNYMGEILLSLRPELKRTTHKLTVQCDGELNFDSFPGAFAQIITNLIMNSLLHAYDSGQAGQIRIDIEKQEDGSLYLFYADDGKGMTPEVRSKAFMPFYTTRRGGGGTGLGLYLLYNIITQQFGGTIVCHSESGAGTQFHIVLANRPRETEEQ